MELLNSFLVDFLNFILFLSLPMACPTLLIMSEVESSYCLLVRY